MKLTLALFLVALSFNKLYLNTSPKNSTSQAIVKKWNSTEQQQASLKTRLLIEYLLRQTTLETLAEGKEREMNKPLVKKHQQTLIEI